MLFWIIRVCAQWWHCWVVFELCVLLHGCELKGKREGAWKSGHLLISFIGAFWVPMGLMHNFHCTGISLSVDQVIPSFWWAALITQILAILLSFIYSCFFSNGSQKSFLLQETWFPSTFMVCAQCPSVANNSTQRLYPCLVSLVLVAMNLVLSGIWIWSRIWTRGWTCSKALSYPEPHLKLHVISRCSVSWLYLLSVLFCGGQPPLNFSKMVVSPPPVHFLLS